MMLRYLSILLVLVSFTAESTLRAAIEPHADRPSGATRTWTSDDLKRLSRVSGLVSIVGQVTNEELPDVDAPAPRARTEDAAWYAAQAASLNARLEADEANVRDFTRALEDARDLKTTTLGINLAEDNIGLTPEATIEILQSRVRETQSEIDALEDLARHDGIPPGVLRGQWQGALVNTAGVASAQPQPDLPACGGDL
jgi:hypothetical protein